jgi:hypothetical protein
MKNIFGLVVLLFALAVSGLCQSPAITEPQVNADITGMYSFVHEGEFVQIEVNEGIVTGLVSCFKDEDTEKAEFVDHFFEQAKLEGTTLSFRTKPTDGAWFEFSGTVERGPSKTPSEEGYWNVRGTLIARHRGADGKVGEKTRGLTLTSFPQDSEPNAGPDATPSATPNATQKQDKME